MSWTIGMPELVDAIDDYATEHTSDMVVVNIKFQISTSEEGEDWRDCNGIDKVRAVIEMEDA